MAEREGFEPPEPCGSAVFKTAAIDHSATSPIFSFETTNSSFKGNRSPAVDPETRPNPVRPAGSHGKQADLQKPKKGRHKGAGLGGRTVASVAT